MSVFTGSGTALVTPFKNGSVDFDAIERLLERQLAGGTDAIVCCATTGESPTLTDSERSEVISFLRKRIGGTMPLIASSGGNNTAHVIETSRAAEALGADALLVVTPYYNKTTQDGLVAHYHAVADAVSIPIIAYNVPGRTGLNIQPKTMARMCEHPNIAGVKEASGNIEQIVCLAALCPECEIYSGNDDQILPILSIGGKGVISTISNVMPREVHDLCASFFAGDIARSRSLQLDLIPLWRAAFCEVNPIPVKTMLHMMGLCEADVRLPLIPPSEASCGLIRETLAHYGLI